MGPFEAPMSQLGTWTCQLVIQMGYLGPKGGPFDPQDGLIEPQDGLIEPQVDPSDPSDPLSWPILTLAPLVGPCAPTWPL